MFTLYLRERFPLRVFGPAAAGIAGAAVWASLSAPSPATLVYAIVMSALLLLQFRLWDDLEDRTRDSVSHPARLLVRTPVAPYRRAGMGLAILCIALGGSKAWLAAVEIALLDLFFYVAYRGARHQVSDTVWRFSILLFKYPAFVVVLATTLGPSQPGRLAAAVLAAYVSACGYEALHRKVGIHHGGRGGRARLRQGYGAQGGSILSFGSLTEPGVASNSVEPRATVALCKGGRVLRGATAILRTFLAQVTS